MNPLEGETVITLCNQDFSKVADKLNKEGKMKYQVYNRITQQFEDFDCIVTQEGQVAFWDDGAGWVEVERSDRYTISWDCEFAGRCWKDSLREALKGKSYGCPGSGI